MVLAREAPPALTGRRITIRQQGEVDEPPLEVTAELTGPPLQQAGSQPLVEHIAQLLEELQQQGEDFTQGEPSSASGAGDSAGPSGSGPSVSP